MEQNNENFRDGNVELIRADCMDYLAAQPDGAFDLAVVDPPYGDGGTSFAGPSRFGGRFTRYGSNSKHDFDWDKPPSLKYFDEIFRVAKNQIIWGGNFFMLPPCRCFLIWRKLSIPSEGFSMSPVEMAWTSLPGNAQLFEYQPQGKPDDPRFHPTQKPIALYDWVFSRFARYGFRILDTHLGSASSAIAAHYAGLGFTGIEISPDFFAKSVERYKRMTAQLALF